MDPHRDREEWARFLVAKLERLSADSIWAHRASGLRGALLRMLAECETGHSLDEAGLERLDRLIAAAFEVLEHAAREIPNPDELRKR